MTSTVYDSKLAELSIQIHAQLNAAKTPEELMSLQLMLLEWHSRAIDLEINSPPSGTGNRLENFIIAVPQ